MNHFNYFTDIEETFIRRRGRHLLLSPLDWALIESWQERGVPLRIVLRGIENVFDGVEKNPGRQKTIKSLMYCKEEIETQYAEWLGAQVGKNMPAKSETAKPERAFDTKNGAGLKTSADSKNVVSSKNIVSQKNAWSHTQTANSVEASSETDTSFSGESSLFSKKAIDAHLREVLKSLERAKSLHGGKLEKILEDVSAEIKTRSENYRSAETLEDDLIRLENLIDRALLENADEDRLRSVRAESEKALAKHKTKMDGEVYQRTFELMVLKNLREAAEIPRLSLFYL